MRKNKEYEKMKKGLYEVKAKGESLFRFFDEYKDLKNVNSGMYRVVAIFDKQVIKVDKDSEDLCCLSEVYFYQKAKERGIECFFVKPTLLDVNERFSAISMPVIKTANEILNSTRPLKLSAPFRMKVLSNGFYHFFKLNGYSDSKIEQLDIFLDDYEISDLHGGNFGLDSKYKFKIVDYACNNVNGYKFNVGFRKEINDLAERIRNGEEVNF